MVRKTCSLSIDFDLINSVGVDQNSIEASSVTSYPCRLTVISSDLDLIPKVKVGHSTADANVPIIILYPRSTYDVIILLDTEVPVVRSCHRLGTEDVGSRFRRCEDT